MSKYYRTSFFIVLHEDGKLTRKRVLVRCTDSDYFFSTLLTKGVKCGILHKSAADYAEAHFFFNGYTWID